MSHKRTRKEFIKLAKESAKDSNGNFYIYDETVYVDSYTKVKILCNRHQEYFYTTPANHLKGQGCRLCGREKTTRSQKKSREQSIIDFKKVHGNKFNYLKTNYINNKTKIEIICSIHGSFWQSPSNHLKGKGCPGCKFELLSKKYSHTTKKFLEKAKLINGNKYNYSLVDYIDSKTKVKIICKIHGIFEQIPYNHLMGSGCPACSGNVISNIEKFKNDSNKIHGDKFDYSLVDYKNSNTKVKIICKIHGIFKQAPTKHLSGHGCPICAGHEISNTNEFIVKANIKHKKRYDYSLVDYKKSNIKVKIICKMHGIFKQKPAKHLSGHGCPSCCHIISKPEILWLDSLNIPNDNTHRNVYMKISGRKFKVDGLDSDNKIIYEFYGDYYHGNPKIFPPNKINPTNYKTFGELYKKTIERENFLKEAGYNIISIWESDWNNQIKNR